MDHPPIRDSKDDRASKGIELLVIDTDYYKMCMVDYHGGDRYPHLVRDESRPDYLDEIVKPEAASNTR